MSDVVTLSLSGEDKDVFELGTASAVQGAEGNQSLTFKDTPDFENPTDLNKDNVYKVTVEASDGSVDGYAGRNDLRRPTWKRPGQ